MIKALTASIALFMILPLTAGIAEGNAASAAGSQKRVSVRRFYSTSDSGWSATFHVISSPKGNILVDPGKYDDELASYVKSIGGLDAILITHGHWDKLRGLDAAVAANPKVLVYINDLDHPSLHDSVLNCSAEDGFSGSTKTDASTFGEGIHEIAGYSVEVIHTPGHTRGSSIFYFKDENMLFGGDMIMADLVGSSRHPSGSEKDRLASIRKFMRRAFPADMKIYCGHGDDTVYADLMKTNADLR